MAVCSVIARMSMGIDCSATPRRVGRSTYLRTSGCWNTALATRSSRSVIWRPITPSCCWITRRTPTWTTSRARSRMPASSNATSTAHGPSQTTRRAGSIPMLNERYVREHADETLAGLRRRHAGPDAERALEQWLALDAGRRATATRRDALARRVADLRAAGGTTAGPDLHAAEHELRAVEEALVVVTAQARRTLQRLPN